MSRAHHRLGHLLTHATRVRNAHAALCGRAEILPLKLSRLQVTWVFAFVVATTLTAPVDAAAILHGRFLPDPTTTTPVFSYGNLNPTTFDRAVFCDTTKIGEIKFDYDTYLEDPTGTDAGGAALSGGFYIEPGYSVSPDVTLAWVQTVRSTQTGDNAWGIDPTSGPFEFPDASRTKPAYPFDTTAAVPPNPPGPPTLGFQDFPDRSFVDGNQSWLAELGLVCIEDDANQAGVRQVFVIATFLWGFNIDTAPTNQVLANSPFAFGAPTASYLATLNDYYDGSPPNPPTSGGFSSMFHFQEQDEECQCLSPVPEPATFMIWSIGSAALVCSARLKSRRLTCKCADSCGTWPG